MLVNQGEAVIFLPGAPHVYGADAEAPWSLIWVNFTGKMTDFIRERLAIEGGGAVLRQNLREANPMLQEMLDALQGGQDLIPAGSH